VENVAPESMGRKRESNLSGSLNVIFDLKFKRVDYWYTVSLYKITTVVVLVILLSCASLWASTKPITISCSTNEA